MDAVLTADQSQALAGSQDESIRLRDPVTNREYLIRAELFDRLRNMLSEDTVCGTAEMLDQIMADDDAHDPYLADLQKKYGGK